MKDLGQLFLTGGASSNLQGCEPLHALQKGKLLIGNAFLLNATPVLILHATFYLI